LLPRPCRGWNQDFIDELESCPNSPNDDQIDAVTTMYETITKRQALVMA
jgi:phage terminase large subunit-like protein